MKVWTLHYHGTDMVLEAAWKDKPDANTLRTHFLKSGRFNLEWVEEDMLRRVEEDIIKILDSSSSDYKLIEWVVES